MVLRPGGAGGGARGPQGGAEFGDGVVEDLSQAAAGVDGAGGAGLGLAAEGPDALAAANGHAAAADRPRPRP